LKKELEPLGVKIVVRDPNWNTNAGAQAVTTLISEKPDVMVLHNPDVQTYAKLIQKAEAEGIDVVQINMRSAYPSVVYVGADWIEIGEKVTTAVADAYLKSGADRSAYFAAVALTACKFQDDPHNQKITHSSFEEHGHNSTHLRDRLLLASARLLAGWPKMPGERDCYGRFMKEWINN
jgi:ABC-type sugar transport system substrate-binding protein